MYSILHLDLWVAHKSWICCLSMGMYVPIAGSRTLAKCEWFDSPCFDIGSNQLYRAQLSEWGHTIGQRFAWRVYKCIFYALAAFELFSAHWSTIVVRNNFEFVLFFFFRSLCLWNQIAHTYIWSNRNFFTSTSVRIFWHGIEIHFYGIFWYFDRFAFSWRMRLTVDSVRCRSISPNLIGHSHWGIPST